ncbi:MAG: DUF192 domain-containing protein [Bdellovibrionales bacterium]|nr:DUF192 domain-containing protein [Bdellovibrionales bacterium]
MSRQRIVAIRILRTDRVIADKCQVAERFLPRFLGLMGKGGLGPGEAMLFPRCGSVHMWFMRFPIDVVFLKTESGADGGSTHRVVSVRAHARPWRPLPLTELGADDTLELPAGAADGAGLAPGELLCIK